MREVVHEVDLCVIGGGLAGMCAAIAAARRGATVALIHDRPVLGGNASSEIRMWVGGAHGPNMRETGILHEIMLENNYRNPLANYSIWDSILYEKVRYQQGITALLNCTCTSVEMDGDRIAGVRGWQLTTETWHTVRARLFADCSGDFILAPLSGAEFRIGREASSEFNEDIEPPVADTKTMGLTCLMQFREMDSPQSYIPPTWANVYASDDDLPNRGHRVESSNFWWMELGGEYDSIHDTEMLRDELLKVAFGVWDHIKNRGEHDAENWTLEWVGFLPGKRESRRYVGDHMLNQNDVRAEGRFDDLVAYGGWSMDDHHPAGIKYPGYPTIFHPAPSPYGIPYRSLYSRNIANLFCAGRNISATHAAMSSTRVMATCAVCGQAVGTAAAIAAANDLTPRGVYQQRLGELQQTLMDDDAFLPRHTRAIAVLAKNAQLTASSGDPEPLRNGVDRPLDEAENAWSTPLDGWAEYRFTDVTPIQEARLIFDSDLKAGGNCGNMHYRYPLHPAPRTPPATLVKAFRLEAQDAKGTWTVVHRETNNYQRLVCVPLNVDATAIRLIPESTWGADVATVFAFEVR